MVAFNRFIAAAFALFAASSTFAMPLGNATLAARAAGDLVCGADRAPLAGLPSADEARLQLTNAAVAAPANRIVKVYWNVIHKDDTFAGGRLSVAQVNAAMNALNSQFSGSGMTFQRVGLKYTKNADWFNKVDNGNALETAMKNLLRLGTAKDLNIYSVGFTTSSLGGFATFPWWYAGAPKLDGVVFKWNTIPGGTLPNYNLGKILTHEVGHWAGLYHTFQGGCSNNAGDYVSDTPAEAIPATGCPVNRDSCPGAAFPGKDPIRNHMDYTYDTCKSGPFTPGQIARMKLAMSIYRNA